MLPSLSA